MAKTALVFSGQGAQCPGMGKSLYECSPAAKAVFDMAERIRPGTLQQCFEGTKEELSLTINTQPCVFITDLAAAAAVKEKGVEPDFVAGFSLGEIAAIAFAGMLSYEDAFRLVCKRAEFMDKAAQEHPGAMAAVVKISPEQTEAICSEFQQAYPVNYNSPAQTVVAAAVEEIDALIGKVKDIRGKAVRLAVSGAFHSPFMDDAAAAMQEYLRNVELKDPVIPVYANRTAQPYEGDYKALIAEQINHPVRWQTTVENMIEAGADRFIEVGVGKTLTGLIGKINADVKAVNIENKEGLDTLKAYPGNDMVTLTGKTAIITGASRGIGKQIALKFAELGANIAFLHFMDAEKAEETVKEIEALGVKAKGYECNVADFEASRNVIDQIIEEFGEVHILVNNAGIVRDNLILKMTEADFDAVISVNLKGAFNMIKNLYQHFMKKRRGRIINISSIVGINGNAGQANYASAKAGMIGLTKSVAKELGGRNVTVNAIAPGFIRTDMTDGMPEKAREEALRAIPLKRAGEVEDIANLAAFLASDAASYITGEVIKVDGGMAI